MNRASSDAMPLAKRQHKNSIKPQTGLTDIYQYHYPHATCKPKIKIP